ncbi:MAG: peptidoglycan editing factor PgeF [Alphaproteobacteria bacterium]
MSETGPTPLTAPALARVAGVRHGFFTRHGGASRGLYASLNCGPGSRDAPDDVQENRRRVAHSLAVAPDHLLTLYQIHSCEVISVDRPWPAAGPPRADGLVTRQPGLALGVLAADCGPILLADGDARVIGACHAGWRGALGGIAEATVAAMVRAGARHERIIAVVGPCIGPDSYEVGPEFPAPFLARQADAAAFFRPARRAGHWLFDLPGYLCQRLSALGLAAVSATGNDTCADEHRFFSYRRGRLAGEPDYGRLLSAIALADE